MRVLILFLFSISALGVNKLDDASVKKEFGGFTGCFIIADLKSGKTETYNRPYCAKRTLPASTFKIPNSLIGLETGILKGTQTTFKWDGKKRWLSDWNRDHNLASAFKYSTVWYYQELASMIGAKRMQRYLNQFDYGNKQISSGITQFWLDGRLQISPVEQLAFWNKFWRNQLGLKKNTIETFKKISVHTRGPGYVLRGKTGSDRKHGKWVLGWYVGELEKNGKIYTFVTRVEGPGAKGPRAREISIKLLQAKGLLPNQL